NTIGWAAQNVLFNTIDAIIGDPAIANAFGGNVGANAHASIEDSTVSASGAIAVTAEADSHLEASVSNTTETAPQRNTKLVGATGISVGAVVTLNKVSSHADAWIDFTSGYSGATTISGGT